MSTALSSQAAPSQLRRVLGKGDLVLLSVVAITNLNLVPVVAAGGPVTLWLWLLALAFFFWPQGVAVIELSARYPGEGGIYLWTKQVFGEFHGFVSGWCYWTNNVFYVPTLLFYLVGISVYAAGDRGRLLGEDRIFVFLLSLGLLWLMVSLNIRGLGVGKWVNNFGGIGTACATVALVGLAGLVWQAHGHLSPLPSLRIAGADWRLVSTFGVICFGLVGLELGSVMGDEIRDPRRTVPSAVLWGGVISGLLYVGATLALLLALPQQEIGVVRGLLQAVSRMADETGLARFVPSFAAVLTISIAGATSAWLAGSARIPFVAGLDRYLPRALGQVHPRYSTPHVALTVHAVLSSLIVAISLVGATVREAYLTMLDLAVILQLVPFLYMYAALARLAVRGTVQPEFFTKGTLLVAGLTGFTTTSLGMILAFVPSRQIDSIWLFETKMFFGCALFLGLATAFFRVYGGRKPREIWSLAGGKSGPPEGHL